MRRGTSTIRQPHPELWDNPIRMTPSAGMHTCCPNANGINDATIPTSCSIRTAAYPCKGSLQPTWFLVIYSPKKDRFPKTDRFSRNCTSRMVFLLLTWSESPRSQIFLVFFASIEREKKQADVLFHHNFLAGPRSWRLHPSQKWRFLKTRQQVALWYSPAKNWRRLTLEHFFSVQQFYDFMTSRVSSFVCFFGCATEVVPNLRLVKSHWEPICILNPLTSRDER